MEARHPEAKSQFQLTARCADFRFGSRLCENSIARRRRRKFFSTIVLDGDSTPPHASRTAIWRNCVLCIFPAREFSHGLGRDIRQPLRTGLPNPRSNSLPSLVQCCPTGKRMGAAGGLHCSDAGLKKCVHPLLFRRGFLETLRIRIRGTPGTALAVDLPANQRRNLS
jgi:hypothetical protein